jgi:hypothetical protein
MKNSLQTAVSFFSLLFVSACGGGGDTSTPTAPQLDASPVTSPVPMPPSGVANPSAPTAPVSNTPVVAQPKPTAPPASSSGSVTFVSPLVSTGDRIGTGLIPQDAVNKLSGAIAKISEAEKSNDSTQYPIAGNQWFLSFTSYVKNSPELSSFGYPGAISNTNSVQIVVARFRSPTAARLFPCVFGDNPLDQVRGECDFSSTVPGAWEGSTTVGSVRTRSIYLKGGPSIQQEISY